MAAEGWNCRVLGDIGNMVIFEGLKASCSFLRLGKGNQELAEDMAITQQSRNIRIKGGTLIVCPMALLGQWKDELEAHSKPDSISVFVHYGGWCLTGTPLQENKGNKGQGREVKCEYKVHSYNRNGLCVLGFMDDHYPVRSAFSLLNQDVDEYQKLLVTHGDLLNQIDPAEADKLLKIQRELDGTKFFLVLSNVLGFNSQPSKLVGSRGSINRYFDFDNWQRVTAIVTTNLNKIIDVIPSKLQRTLICIAGSLGLVSKADTFILLGMAFYSPEAKDLNKETFETIYYHALKASSDLAAKEEGPL
nr:ribonucleoside-diphosphate reductase large subunit-like [Ipomoea batatas]